MSEPNSFRSYTASVFGFGDHNGAHRGALRVGFSVLVPLVALYATGHMQWSIYAAFGAFASVYGRGSGSVARLKMQATAGGVLVVTVVLGALVATTAEKDWVIVAIAAIWASAVALASEVFRWAPPGPLFAVFGLCSVASIPSGWSEVPVAAGISLLAAVFAVAVGQIGAIRRRLPSTHPADATVSAEIPAPTSIWRRIRSTLASRRGIVRIGRFGVAAGLAGAISTGLGIGHPYWAILTAVVPLVASDLTISLAKGTQRVLGTTIGLAVAWALLSLNLSGLWVILLVVALQIVAELLVMRNYGLALVFITPLALVMVSLAHTANPNQLIADRAVETLLGTVVGLAVALASRNLMRPSAVGRGGTDGPIGTSGTGG
ncbi:FUSC family protein [Subtercola frigoramans]|uniref:Integral membrane bound transporter domain-containing protein n=1 Tax=Subtercola frigoramans TaxID=120298 RepID=A0ABS2L408_9MICO|nr:FUSC family protein [Subtercola frigoramans]MBM7471836.1 hypothetical protein [Subtercola frigoramans]